MVIWTLGPAALGDGRRPEKCRACVVCVCAGQARRAFLALRSAAAWESDGVAAAAAAAVAAPCEAFVAVWVCVALSAADATLGIS